MYDGSVLTVPLYGLNGAFMKVGQWFSGKNSSGGRILLPHDRYAYGLGTREVREEFPEGSFDG